MSASNSFRSHLMQQFVAAARTQSRPPLALIGLTRQDEDSLGRATTPPSRQPPLAGQSRKLSSLKVAGSGKLSSLKVAGNQATTPFSQSPTLASTPDDATLRLVSSSISPKNAEDKWATSHDTSSSMIKSNPNLAELPELFQNLLRTRRSSSRFGPAKHDERDLSYWKQALDRAVQCGLTAPNHKRTEPFRFRRMLAPSKSTTQLAEIAYQVTLRQSKDPSADATQEAAARKREKWSQIPAFLVTLVESTQDFTVPALSSATPQPFAEYLPLPFVAPCTERELEDYAAACAAVQNILLSLHAEQIASKWVTGSVIQTPAFRQLVRADPHDRVVALIMVGEPHPMSPQRPRRHRRTLDQVLLDLE